MGAMLCQGTTSNVEIPSGNLGNVMDQGPGSHIRFPDSKGAVNKPMTLLMGPFSPIFREEAYHHILIRF
jgi:hypothetical protein